MAEPFSMQREYPAPPAQVYEAWTNIDLLRQWFGCGPGMLWTVHEWDVRVGGALHVSLEFDRGPFEIRGEFLVVEPPRRLSYRWSGSQIVVVTIDAHGSGSRLTVEHFGLFTDEECAITSAGWTFALGQVGSISSSAPARP